MNNQYNIQLPSELLQSKNRPFIMAHRGCRSRAPENSLLAFQLALDDGADVIETDLRFTRDNVIVCIHDRTVDRTTHSTGKIEDLSWSSLRKMQLRKPDGQGQQNDKIPALEEVLERFSKSTFFALELKHPAFTKSGEIDSLLRLLEDYGCYDRVILMSFSQAILRYVEMVVPTFPLVHISLFSPWPSARYPFVGAWWPMFFINPFYAQISRGRGQICCPLDTKPEPRLRAYLAFGVDALLSDDPRLTRRRINEYRNLSERNG